MTPSHDTHTVTIHNIKIIHHIVTADIYILILQSTIINIIVCTRTISCTSPVIRCYHNIFLRYQLADDMSIIIRKTKCFDFWERNVLFPKTKRSFFRTPKHPLPCPFPLNFSLLIITKKFGNLAKNRYICIV